MAQAGMMTQGFRQQAGEVPAHKYSTSTAPTVSSHKTAGLSRMALISHAERCGIAGADYKPVSISEEPAEKPETLSNPTQPPLPEHRQFPQNMR